MYKLDDEKKYYILLGKKKEHEIFKPLFLDVVSKTKIRDCITSNSIGTIFDDKKMTRCAIKILSRRFKHIKIAQLKIIGDYKQ